jgi:antitoxin (DNA-binding transcriptional repressor) of toxin-antitoxin stability system
MPNTTGAIAEVASRSYIDVMRAVGLKVLKNKLSEYVRLVAGGETVLVTDRDRVVAELVPPREGRSALLADAQLADAVRLGWITPPVVVSAGAPARSPVATFDQLMRELDRDRGDR